MPSTVQVQECAWKTPDGKNNIKIVGFRHGLLSINKNSVPDLQEHIKNDDSHILLVEQNLNRVLKDRGLPKGKDVRDHQAGKGLSFRKMLLTALLPIIAPLAFVYDRLTRNSQGLHKHANSYPSYDDRLASINEQLPEPVEKQIHDHFYQQGKHVQEAKLDRGFWRSLTNDRSAYMAGYAAAVAEVNPGKEVVVAMGGAHLPRVRSCLSYQSQDKMPWAMRKKFEQGYQNAQKNTGHSL